MIDRATRSPPLLRLPEAPVRFPGGTRYDQGLLYALSAAGVAVVVSLISRRRFPPGVVFGVVVALLSITRLVIVRLGNSIGLADEIFAGVAFVSGCQIVAVRWRARGL